MSFVKITAPSSGGKAVVRLCKRFVVKTPKCDCDFFVVAVFLVVPKICGALPAMWEATLGRRGGRIRDTDHGGVKQ